MNRTLLVIAGAVLILPTWGRSAEPLNVTEIVQRSVENTNADWAVAPQYNFTERDVITKGGTRTVKTYQVSMIDGSPYNKLIAIDDHELSEARAAVEERKFRQEVERRQHETPAQRRKRIAMYQRGRRQDHHLMQQMVKAFDFKLAGQDTVNGRHCYVLQATPRPDYRPVSRDTKVLKGMRGTMWVDTEQYQWVKVHAEVFRPVAFGLFIAHVRPGTEFTLEQSPVKANVWLPSHFSTRVNASILVVLSRRSTDEETYSGYHYVGGANASPASPARRS